MVIVMFTVHHTFQRFHIISPMYVGFANTVNSLYNIKKMVYDQNNIVSLETLRMALFNNWGEK